MNTDQPNLFEAVQRTPRRRHFGGSTYEAAHDEARLTSQLERVKALLLGTDEWLTLGEIKTAIGGSSEAGISARLRDLRRQDNGGFTVDGRRRGLPAAGLWEYRIRKD